MKKLTMFIIDSCPYCRKALGWMDELRGENDAYKALEVEMIDENLNPDIANSYDYHYVPTFFLGDEKLHEGAASLEKIRYVFDFALERI